MKKSILFLIGNLESGGVSKSMVSLLNTIDRQKYDVSLWMGSPMGLFYGLLPKDITLLSDDRITFLLKGKTGLYLLLKHDYFLLFIGSLLRLFFSCINKSYAGWWLSKLMPIIENKEYDLIVDYNGQHQLYYMVDKLKGKKKVSFFHSDYSKWSYYYAADKKYFSKIDAVFTISPHCVKVLKEWFPTQADKICLMENITSPKLIEKLSEEAFENPWRKDAIRLITVGHVVDTKGSHWAIEAAYLLKERGIDIHWIFVGSVSDAPRYHKMVNIWNLKDYVDFIGVTPNPYPYIKRADIVVHPSQFEGKSIALDEAKLLCKPIVVTNYSTVNDQFVHGVNATICEMNPVSIADAIVELIKDKKMRERYVGFLKSHKSDNTSEINKIYKLID